MARVDDSLSSVATTLLSLSRRVTNLPQPQSNFPIHVSHSYSLFSDCAGNITFIRIMTYKAGIITAIQELGDRNGSSSISIKKHMQANLPKEKTWQNATFLAALKNGVEKGEFLKNKNSFKLSADLKKKVKGSSATPKVATKAKTVAKETTVKRTISPKKKAFKKKATKQTPDQEKGRQGNCGQENDHQEKARRHQGKENDCREGREINRFSFYSFLLSFSSEGQVLIYIKLDVV